MKPTLPLNTTPSPRHSTFAQASTVPVVSRVTVRLKPALAARLALAKCEQGLSATQVIETALEKYLPPPSTTPKLTLLETFEKHGLLGTVAMPPDASVAYKTHIAEHLAKKHGYR